MLEKIVQIKGVGRFRDYRAAGDVALRKLTLVYAENGRGKTTLCGILRSLQTGRADFIAERKTLGATGETFVHLRLMGADYKFTSGAWTEAYPGILIFDPVFVHDNVYAGDLVEHEHKKNLYLIIVGTEGVRLAKEIEQLDGQIREANNSLRAKMDGVSRHVPSGVTIDAYLQWEPIPDVETQIRQKTDEINTRLRAIAKSDEIRAKSMLARVQIPSLPPDLPEVLSKQLTDIATDAEARVREQISRHLMERQGESWLSQGLDFVKDDKCPFCGQDVRTNQMLAAYRSYFGAAYRALKQEVAQLSRGIDEAIGEGPLAIVCQRLAENMGLLEFWRQFISIELPDLSSEDIWRKYARLREASLVLARKKRESPTDAVVVDTVFSAALAEVSALREDVASYNAAVNLANSKIDAQKAAIASDDAIATLRNDLDQLEARKNRFATDVAGECRAYQDALSAKADLEQRKEACRSHLDKRCRDLFSEYEQSINAYLDQFNAGFRITNTHHRYTGGTPSCQYQLEINSTALDTGDTRTPLGTPCFKTALSSGDRSALALAFFLAMLGQDPDISRRTVVFDDPLTSLDRFRRTWTQQVIRRVSDAAEQVIVLSHDPGFLRLLYDECSQAADRKALQMSRAGDTTIIGEWDIEREAISTYMKDYYTLLAFYRQQTGDVRAVARAIRPFLEAWLRIHFPGHFEEKEWLGDFIGKIRTADPASGLQHARADLRDLDEINAYSKRYHHDQSASADTEPIDADELHSYVKRTLRFVGGAKR